jgi:hypothetical protein
MHGLPTLDLRFASSTLTIPVRYLLNVGYAGRNRATVEHHLDELAKIGVARPRHVPTAYPVANSLATTSHHIQVQHNDTSGEVEYVVIVAGEELYVTVGSDHSDRKLEQRSVPLAKQACPNIVAPEAWRYRDVERHWDDLVLRSWVSRKGDWFLYQEASLSELLPVEDLLDLSRQVLGDLPTGLILFSGTVPAKGGLICGDAYRIELEDPRAGKKIDHEYTVEVLPPAIE